MSGRDWMGGVRVIGRAAARMRIMDTPLYCFLQQHQPLSPPPLFSASFCFSTNRLNAYNQQCSYPVSTFSCCRFRVMGKGIQTVVAEALPESSRQSNNSNDEYDDDYEDDEKEQDEQNQQKQLQQQLTMMATVEEEAAAAAGLSGTSGTILSACVVGLLTGISVVLFNKGVHEIRDFFWDGIPHRGASWLRVEPIDSIWTRVILVPTCGGFIVSILNALRSALQDRDHRLKAAFLKVVAACFTLGTGNSLGPEGPSVEIGASIAKGIASLTPLGAHESNSQTKLSLLAAGSAAGISSGFNAAVAGCFFAVESVLWPSPGDSSTSLTNTTSMVIISAVIASVVSEVGLGFEPAFTVPEYDFRSFGELPLYLLLGVFCGLISLTLSRCTSTLLLIVDNIHKNLGIPRAAFPVMGGFATGMIALAYPEILYWGFQNVDILLESRPFVKGLSAELLLQLVGIKIVATSLCRASGLVGGYYAPSLFIGAATGMAYGKLINFVVAQSNPTFRLSILEVASPQAYGLVGMAATLAGVCQVPLTAVLLLFELTQDYRIVLPLLGAVGLSSWITSGQAKRNVNNTAKLNKRHTSSTRKTQVSSFEMSGLSSGHIQAQKASHTSSLCEVESSLCVDDSSSTEDELKKKIFVSQAMRTRYITVLMNTPMMEALTLMLAEKQSCAMIVDEKNILIGLLILGDIEDFCKITKARNRISEELLVSSMCSLDKCHIPWTANPGMDILSVQIIMNKKGVTQVPVVSDHRGNLVGLIDEECIRVTCRALAARESLL